MRRARENSLAFLLRYAAQHSESLALALKFAEIGETVEDLLLRLVSDRAGVVED